MLWRRYTARWRWGGGARALLALAALALALAALRVPLARRSQRSAALGRAPAHTLAAYLADFNNLRNFYPHIESWRVDAQWSNYTSWRYSVRYRCGARCGGRGALAAHDEYAGAAPAHGRASAAHQVLLRLAECRTLPLLPWPAFCEELEVDWRVTGDGAGGARLQEAAAARAPALLGWLRGAGALSATRLDLDMLRDAFS